jgi:sarcosine oxidase
MIKNGIKYNLTHSILNLIELNKKYPYFKFNNSEHSSIYLKNNAGFINPRKLIKAQNFIAKKNGADLIDEEFVIKINHSKYPYEIITNKNNIYFSKKIVLTTGAFTNIYDLLPISLNIRLTGNTLLFAEVDKNEIEKLKEMPTIVYVSDIGEQRSYTFPPIKYPNNKYFVKIGGESSFLNEPVLRTKEEILGWYKGNGSLIVKEKLKKNLKLVLPDLNIKSFKIQPCIVTHTSSELPILYNFNKKFTIAIAGN